MVPNLFVYEKSALTPILTKKFKNAGGRDRGLSQKFFDTFKIQKLAETASKPLSEIRSQHQLQVTNSLLDGEVKVGICHSETDPSRKFETGPLSRTSL
jgi:hypothetical protein